MGAPSLYVRKARAHVRRLRIVEAIDFLIPCRDARKIERCHMKSPHSMSAPHVMTKMLGCWRR